MRCCLPLYVSSSCGGAVIGLRMHVIDSQGGYSKPIRREIPWGISNEQGAHWRGRLETDILKEHCTQSWRIYRISDKLHSIMPRKSTALQRSRSGGGSLLQTWLVDVEGSLEENSFTVFRSASPLLILLSSEQTKGVCSRLLTFPQKRSKVLVSIRILKPYVILYSECRTNDSVC